MPKSDFSQLGARINEECIDGDSCRIDVGDETAGRSGGRHRLVTAWATIERTGNYLACLQLCLFNTQVSRWPSIADTTSVLYPPQGLYLLQAAFIWWQFLPFSEDMVPFSLASV